jgi:hypothetical protein
VRNDKAALGRLVAFKALGQTKRLKGHSLENYTAEVNNGRYLNFHLPSISI